MTKCFLSHKRYLPTCSMLWRTSEHQNSTRSDHCITESNPVLLQDVVVPVQGLPQHQTVVSVEVVWELGHASVPEVVLGLQGAVGQHLVLPLGQNQQAVTTRRHDLHRILGNSPVMLQTFTQDTEPVKYVSKCKNLSQVYCGILV